MKTSSSRSLSRRFALSRSVILSLLVVLAAAISACSSSETAKPAEPTELRTTEGPTVDTPEAQLFHESKRLYRAGLYSVAVDSFESLRVNYPLSPYVEFAEIKIADARFETREFAQAAVAYEEFVKSHPASSITPYAILQAGRSHQLTNRGVGRDIGSLEKARDFYTRLIQSYPQSYYTRQARGYLKEVTEGIAENEKFVMDFYRRKNNAKAVEARAKVYEEKILPAVEKVGAEHAAEHDQTTPPAAVRPENPTVLAAMRASSPKSAGASGSPDSARAALSPLTAEIDPTNLDVQRIQCRSGKIFVFLRRPYETSLTELEPQRGQVRLTLEGLTARPATLDCQGKADLTVTAHAVLTLQSDKAWDLMTVDNPPRLVLVER